MKTALPLLLALAAGAAQAQHWDFEARLDGRPIGRHRFTVSGADGAREVKSEASFTVKLLGLVVYRYRHEAQERWQGDCLQSLRSSTDDDGKPERVDHRAAAGEPCLMGFAYWHPRLHTQSRLLNPQTGRIETVRFERLEDASLTVNGQPVPARRWQLQADAQLITVWTSLADDRWIGLDARVAGGRMLSYRLP